MMNPYSQAVKGIKTGETNSATSLGDELSSYENPPRRIRYSATTNPATKNRSSNYVLGDDLGDEA